jgi:bifunctional UDP-N-acetylglucosamine pyrophosphorylase/glucosamine-1-phosphate N-acetyltransferase
MNTLPKTDNVALVILAAGEGKRMQSTLPKVMIELKGRPLIDYVVSAVEKTGIKPVAVVSARDTLAQNYLGERAGYVIQEKQLGTGHAVAQTESSLENSDHTASQATITLGAITVTDFNEWRSSLKDFGRIVRNNSGEIVKSVELKDATPDEASSNELNPCYYVFEAKWLWENLKKLTNDNSQGEYYLTDLIEMAVHEGKKISSVAIDPKEAIGINTQEGLAMAEGLTV